MSTQNQIFTGFLVFLAVVLTMPIWHPKNGEK